MKFNIDVDCTPQEMRGLLGLPDLSPLHDAYLEKMKGMMDSGITPDVMETMMKSWMPTGETGMTLFSSLLGGAASKGKVG